MPTPENPIPEEAQNFDAAENAETTHSGFLDTVIELKMSLDAGEQQQITAQQELWQAKQEGKRRATEAAEPLFEQLHEQRGQDDVVDGAEYYAILKGDQESFARYEEQRFTSREAEGVILDQINNVYEKESGEPYRETIAMTPEERRARWQETKTLDTVRMQDIRRDFSQGKLFRGGRINGGISNPGNLVRELRNIREQNILEMTTRNQRIPAEMPFPREEAVRINDKAYGHPRVARGMALAALEAGDVGTAADALAFAESAQPMSDQDSERFKALLANLDEQKRREFIKQFESQRAPE